MVHRCIVSGYKAHSTKSTFSTPYGDVSAYKIQRYYTVTFDYEGYGTNTTQEVFEGDTIVDPTEPVRTGYTFKYWSTSEDGTDFSSTGVTSDITLVPVFSIDTFTVTFLESDGATVFTTETVDYNSTATAPSDDPTKTGYTFAYWSTSEDGDVYDFSTAITSDVTLYPFSPSIPTP